MEVESNIVITVLMAVYNGENSVGKAVESILGQKFKDFEFLIVNDCSTDKTVDVINAFGDARIRIIDNNKNIGQTKSLNVGLALARGEYVARIDADDYSFSERLTKQYEYLTKYPEYTLVGTDCLVINDSNEKITVRRKCSNYEDIVIQALTSSPVNHVSVLMRRDDILNVGGYNPDFKILADYELWSRLIVKGFNITNIPKVLTAYTISERSYGKRNKDIAIEEKIMIVQNIIEALSTYQIDKANVRKLIDMFESNITSMTDEEIRKTEALYSDILLNFKPELGIRVTESKIRNLMKKNYYMEAYHFLLEKKGKETRKIVRKSIQNHGVDPYSIILLLLSFLNIGGMRKLNYIRAKYL